MTILKKETKDNNRVELTIRVEKPEWQKALDDAYQANRDLYPVDGCAPGKPVVFCIVPGQPHYPLYKDAAAHSWA